MDDERIARLVRAAAVVVALYQRGELNPAAIYDLDMAVLDCDTENGTDENAD